MKTPIKTLDHAKSPNMQRGDKEMNTPINVDSENQTPMESFHESEHSSSKIIIGTNAHTKTPRGSEIQLKKASKLIEETKKQIQQRRNSKEDEDMENNI